MNEIIWGLSLNYAKANGVWFNYGTETQLKLNELAEYIAKKLNVFSYTVIRWLKGMKYSHYGIDVCDACGLNAIYIKK